MLRLCSLLLLLAATLVSCEVIHFQSCSDECSIAQVRVDPCPQAAHNAACNIRRRRPTTMSFDFTPKFNAATLETTLVWVKSETHELPLISLERDTCKTISCPIKSGEQQTYTMDVPIEAKFPISGYTIRWRLTDPVSKQHCCFQHDIKVVR
ncbi:MD-2-related lipid-recognition protein-like [Drosophila busckii]|nr:MD-2-related lipid-recognition protein-like [Drosophila busckii]